MLPPPAPQRTACAHGLTRTGAAATWPRAWGSWGLSSERECGSAQIRPRAVPLSPRHGRGALLLRRPVASPCCPLMAPHCPHPGTPGLPFSITPCVTSRLRHAGTLRFWHFPLGVTPRRSLGAATHISGRLLYRLLMTCSSVGTQRRATVTRSPFLERRAPGSQPGPRRAAPVPRGRRSRWRCRPRLPRGGAVSASRPAPPPRGVLGLLPRLSLLCTSSLCREGARLLCRVEAFFLTFQPSL